MNLLAVQLKGPADYFKKEGSDLINLGELPAGTSVEIGKEDVVMCDHARVRVTPFIMENQKYYFIKDTAEFLMIVPQTSVIADEL